MNSDRLITFSASWERYFRLNLRAHPAQYATDANDPDAIDLVVTRMRSAIDRGTYNKDSASFKAACKELGIKHTYKAIGTYLDGL
jgi:hypothetical protein